MRGDMCVVWGLVSFCLVIVSGTRLVVVWSLKFFRPVFESEWLGPTYLVKTNILVGYLQLQLTD